jgi:protein phosphatase
MELRLDAHLITDVGLARERNEDRCGAFTPEDEQTLAERGRLFVVADGMGGHADGDIAAEMTVQSLPAEYFQGEWEGPTATLRRAFVLTNASIEQRAASEPGRHGMGAAAVAVVVVGERAFVAHLGDCRAYLVRDGEVRRLTADHSWVEERVAAGQLTADEAKVHHYRNVLTRALGAEDGADPTIQEIEFAPGDVLILCSDGLWGMVDDAELGEHTSRAAEAQTAATALVDLALERGGPDNISVALIRAVSEGGQDEPTTERSLAPK